MITLRKLQKGTICTIVATTIFIISGCAASNKALLPEEVKKHFADINYSDGINKIEAKTIAQNHLIDHPANEPINLANPSVYRERYRNEGKSVEEYIVSFQYSNAPLIYPFSWYVIIDPQSGEIKQSKQHCSK